MTVKISEVIHERLGWCPAARGIRAAQVPVAAPQVVTTPAGSGSSTGSRDRLDRGARLAVGSIRILFRNPHLLWFLFLIGIVMLFNLASTIYLQYISGSHPFPGIDLGISSPAVIIAEGSLVWGVLTFGAAFITMVCTNFVLAALFISTSGRISGKSTTLRQGFSGAGRSTLSLAGWAVVGAVLGTLNAYVTGIYDGNIPVILLSAAIIVAIFIVTIYVIPLIVLDGRKLAAAITESLSVVRRTWGEIVVCFGIYLLLAFMISLASIIPITALVLSSGSTVQTGTVVILYMLLNFGIVIIGWTIIGIATLGLYIYGKTGSVNPFFDGKTSLETLE
ncbi:MAG TPA: DUF6159 family protein [Methanoregulaceae archaeon]|nr:DUF6159 family protein [Methanoregulaceae archaeon]HPD75974.1 DUF6159 family protein [Methanoregulaceae archaeon]HRY74939.1 DUF6159 family protein [Methanoregulaceae archaeon]